MKKSFIVMSIIAGAAFVAIACHKDGNDKDDGVKSEEVVGIWQLSGTHQIVERKENDKNGTAQTMLVTEGREEVKDEDIKYLLISKHRINIMNYDGSSDKCELSRSWFTRGRSIILDQSSGCINGILDIDMVSLQRLNLSGMSHQLIKSGNKAVILSFDTITSSAIRSHFESLGLVGEKSPQALKNYVAQLKDEGVKSQDFGAVGDAGSPNSQSAATQGKGIFYPISDDILTLKKVTVTGMSDSSYVTIQDNKIITPPPASNSDKASCTIYGYGQLNKTWDVESISSSLDASASSSVRVRVTIRLGVSSESITCTSAANTKTFTMEDFKKVAGSFISFQ